MDIPTASGGPTSNSSRDRLPSAAVCMGEGATVELGGDRNGVARDWPWKVDGFTRGFGMSTYNSRFGVEKDIRIKHRRISYIKENQTVMLTTNRG